MSKSKLSRKLLLCDLVKQLDESACLDVIRSVYRPLGYQNLNQFLIAIIMKLVNNTTSDNFTHIENIVREIIATTTSTSNNSENKNNAIKCKTKKEEQRKSKLQLLNLPIDIINKSATFLNETEVFNLDICCKLFYQIINNSSYLKQSNNFKIFTITPETMNQMLNTKTSFYKYSFCHTLILENAYDDVRLDIDELEEKLNQIQTDGNCNEYMSNMFKSIKSLECDGYGSLLLQTLPLEQLFDPNKSQLLKIVLKHGWNAEENIYSYVDDYNEYLNEFERKYLDIKESLIRQGKNIKMLDCIKHSTEIEIDIKVNIPHQFEHIESKHIHLSFATIDLSDWDLNHNSSLKMITLEWWSNFRIQTKMKNNYNGNIETLRLIYPSSTKEDRASAHIENKNLIESLHLHNDVKNLTIWWKYGYEEWEWQKKQILDLLLKKHYFNLQNINILLNIWDAKTIDLFFELLKQYWKILKYQFKKLNIGLKGRFNKYQIIEWNCNINDKKLDQERKKWDQLDSSPLQCQKYRKKYLELQNQWVK